MLAVDVRRQLAFISQLCTRTRIYGSRTRIRGMKTIRLHTVYTAPGVAACGYADRDFDCTWQ